LRAENRITLPSTMALEKLTNPFLRTAETSVKQKVDERKGSKPAPSVFAALAGLERYVLTARYTQKF
jgi:hydroxyacylglutathione hydrolase